MADAPADTTPAKAPEEPTPAETKAEESTPAAAPAEPAPAKAVEETPAEAAPADSAKEDAAPAESAPEPANKDPEPAPATAEETKTAAPPADGTVKKVEAATKTPPVKPLTKLFAELASIKKEADYGEMWGVELSDETHVPSTIVLEKFLRANNKDVTKARAQLTDALKWRKRIQPAKLLAETEFDPAKFSGLGYVTIYPKTDKHEKEILTWNIYGGVKTIKSTFGNVEEFIKWRAALMELSVQELDLPSATEKIPEHGNDPYRMVQVHDYLNVSFLRMDPSVRAASKETIQTFSMAYPELLKEKFFVNVPLVMGWVFAAMKIFLSPDTIKKFHPLSYGSNLAGELKAFGQELPPVYGGKGKDVKEGLTVKYASVQAAEKKPAAVEAVEKEAAPVEAVEKEAAPVEAPKKKDAPAEAVEKEAAPVEAPKKKDAPAEAADKTDAPAEAADKTDAPAEVAEKTDVAVEGTEQKDATVEVSA